MRINYLKKLFFLRTNCSNIFDKVKTVSLPGIQKANIEMKTESRSTKELTGINGLPLQTVLSELNKFADLSLAEKWDNVGLLIEPSTETSVNKILLTNDLTEIVMNEAIEKQVNLIISYHPPIFSPLKRITQASWKERIVSSCIENRIAVFSPHTSWDAVYGGVADWLADAFGSYIKLNGKASIIPSAIDDSSLYVANIIGTSETIDTILKEDISVKINERFKWDEHNELCTAVFNKKTLDHLKSVQSKVNIGIMECRKNDANVQVGMGRIIQVSNITLQDCVNLIKGHTGVSHVRLACARNQTEASSVKTIALVPGSGGSLLKGAKADLYITGEMFHHDVLDANHNGASVILTNHSDSERGFLHKMALLLADIFKNDIKIELSLCDSDPLKTV